MTTSDKLPVKEGLRAQKQRQTRIQIGETALKLFLANGYEGTTLDDIAQAAGISRRTFFAYFKSKDDILLAWQAAAWDGVLAEILLLSPVDPPLEAVRKVLVSHVSRYESEQMKAIDRVMIASETLRVKKQAVYGVQELQLFEVLCQVWAEPERRPALRIVAMFSIGAMRLALEAWRPQSEHRSLASVLEKTFAQIRSEI